MFNARSTMNNEPTIRLSDLAMGRGMGLRRWVTVATMVLLCACQQETEIVERLRPVKSMEVTQNIASSRERTFTGSVETAQEIKMSFRVEGTVIELPVSVGERLSKGDLIAALDEEPYRVALEEARADLAQTNASRRSAEAEYQRVRQLYASDNASRTELDEALADSEASRADYNARAQALRRAELNLSYTRLTSEGECSVAVVDVEVNENISTGLEVVRLSCGDNWEVVIDVPESQIGLFQNNLEAAVRFPSIRESQFRAVVSEVGVTSAGNTSFPVTLRIVDPPTTIRSNLAAEVTIALPLESGPPDHIWLPVAAVSQDQNGTFVYIVDASDEPGVALLRRESVQVGGISEDGIEIVSGVAVGQQILLAGHANARDGMRVLQR